MNKPEEALTCALTYLLFHEGEGFMTENVKYFTQLLGHSGKARQVSYGYKVIIMHTNHTVKEK